MKRYDMQKEIFRLTMKLYPNKQHEEVYKHLQNLWKRDAQTIDKYLQTLKGIVNG